MRLSPLLEWTAIIVVSLAIAVGAIAVLSGVFTGHDPAGVSGPSGGPGIAFRNLGAAHLRPGAPHPAYGSNPPTSGAHVPEAVGADNQELNDDQLLQALEVGDVVILYGTPTPPPGLQALARSVAAPFTPALAASGQAVILARRPRILGLVALAWTHAAQGGSPNDPALRQFAQYWLGRGAR